MPDTWVVVADSSAAHIFTAAHRHAPLTLVESLTHAESRMHPRERLSDVAGRGHDPVGPGRHGLDQGQTLRDEDRQRFAREIAARLEAAHRLKRFNDLIVMAGPAFLGVLRDALSKTLQQATVAEVPKDLVAQDTAAIEAHIP